MYRFTFLLPLPDGSLLAATESPQGPGAVRIENPGGASPTVHPVDGVSGYVLRWARWNAAVLAVVQTSNGTALLRSDDDGRAFAELPAPREVESVAVAGATLYALADGALYSTDDGLTFTERAPREEALRHRPSSLVSAPLVAHRGSLWAASTRTGEVFELR